MSHAPIKHDRKLKWVAVDQVIKNERNPRRKEHFEPDQLETLRRSIETHGVLEPIIVEPYDHDMYLLIEGERRWTTAKLLGLKEIPAVIVNRLDEHDEVVVMFNIHANRRGWEMAEELRSIKELKERNGHMTDEELARELGVSTQKLRERLTVLGMGDRVAVDIAKGDLDYSSALRTRQVTRRIARSRPQLVEKLGGESVIEERLLRKAKERKGISQELVEASRDLGDPEAMSDAAVEHYLGEPRLNIRQVRTSQSEQKRKVDDLAKELRRMEKEIMIFDADIAEAPNLRALRGALASLIATAQDLEDRVVKTLLDRPASTDVQ